MGIPFSEITGYDKFVEDMKKENGDLDGSGSGEKEILPYLKRLIYFLSKSLKINIERITRKQIAIIFFITTFLIWIISYISTSI